MKKLNVTVSVIPDIRREKADGTMPLKLRVTNKGKRKYYATGFDATTTDWEIIQSNKAKGALRKLALDVAEIEVNAQKCCDDIDRFSFMKFEAVYFPKELAVVNLKTAFDSYMKNLMDNDQLGTADCYKSACTSLHKFKPKIELEQITADFLKSYEKWFINNGKSVTTVGIYLRSLRAVLNFCIGKGLMDANDYPFGKRKYIIPSGRNIKKALTLEEIARIYNYNAPMKSVDDMCRDYWIFIYLCNGLNVKDLCLLRYKNIEGNFLVFHRAKTIRRKRSNPEPIRVAIKDDTKRIIEKWGQQKINNETFVFPHFHINMTSVEQRDKKLLLIHLINEHMKSIASKLGIDKPVTTYFARHSFATVLKNSGVSTEFISEALGHSSLSTTKNYLAGFEKEAIQKTTDVLISFKDSASEVHRA